MIFVKLTKRDISTPISINVGDISSFNNGQIRLISRPEDMVQVSESYDKITLLIEDAKDKYFNEVSRRL